MEGTIGEIRLFAGNFAPRSWAFCQGQLLAISQNTALFSILGTTYGGDGRTTFGLPDLRGRVPVGVGSGPGLTSRVLGQKFGNETTVLSEANLPAHTHTATGTPKCVESVGNQQSPAGNALAVDATQSTVTYSNAAADASMQANSVDVTVNSAGGNAAFSNTQPSLGMNYIICLQGVFPSRN